MKTHLPKLSTKNEPVGSSKTPQETVVTLYKVLAVSLLVSIPLVFVALFSAWIALHTANPKTIDHYTFIDERGMPHQNIGDKAIPLISHVENYTEDCVVSSISGTTSTFKSNFQKERTLNCFHPKTLDDFERQVSENLYGNYFSQLNGLTGSVSLENISTVVLSTDKDSIKGRSPAENYCLARVQSKLVLGCYVVRMDYEEVVKYFNAEDPRPDKKRLIIVVDYVGRSLKKTGFSISIIESYEIN